MKDKTSQSNRNNKYNLNSSNNITSAKSELNNKSADKSGLSTNSAAKFELENKPADKSGLSTKSFIQSGLLNKSSVETGLSTKLSKQPRLPNESITELQPHLTKAGLPSINREKFVRYTSSGILNHYAPTFRNIRKDLERLNIRQEVLTVDISTETAKLRLVSYYQGFESIGNRTGIVYGPQVS